MQTSGSVRAVALCDCCVDGGGGDIPMSSPRDHHQHHASHYPHPKPTKSVLALLWGEGEKGRRARKGVSARYVWVLYVSGGVSAGVAAFCESDADSLTGRPPDTIG